MLSNAPRKCFDFDRPCPRVASTGVFFHRTVMLDMAKEAGINEGPEDETEEEKYHRIGTILYKNMIIVACIENEPEMTLALAGDIGKYALLCYAVLPEWELDEETIRCLPRGVRVLDLKPRSDLAWQVLVNEVKKKHPEAVDAKLYHLRIPEDDEDWAKEQATSAIELDGGDEQGGKHEEGPDVVESKKGSDGLVENDKKDEASEPTADDEKKEEGIDVIRREKVEAKAANHDGRKKNKEFKTESKNKEIIESGFLSKRRVRKAVK